jgi:hypothetical protein
MSNHRIRHHGHAHQERHARVKRALKNAPPPEKVWPVFINTFIVAVLVVMVYTNWGIIEEKLTPEPPPPPPQTHGFQTGVTATVRMENQANAQYRNLLASIHTSGGVLGVSTTGQLGQKPMKTPDYLFNNALQNSVYVTNTLSAGQHLTKWNQNRAGSLQKSIVATYYLSDRAIDINSTLQNDTRLMSRMNNALTVDLFAYLNQSSSRADALDGYLNLLETLNEKALERMDDLNRQVSFLTGNFNARETRIEQSQEEFFRQIERFNGPNAEEELGRFIGLQQGSDEIRAKIGAYSQLWQYYEFYQSRLEPLIREIRLNRDPLIAGVRVVEIENMQLPLIINGR